MLRLIWLALRTPPKFYVSTLTGMLMAINIVMFIVVGFAGNSFWFPEQDALHVWGAKDIVAINQGQWWRYLTAMFLHAGALHFTLNMVALRFLGIHLEGLIGWKRLALIYFAAGIAGFVASSAVGTVLTMGASGAIFGLMGIGVLIERKLGDELGLFRSVWRLGPLKVAVRPYMGMVVLNVGLAIILNQLLPFFGIEVGIDSAAHLGGLGVGLALFRCLQIRTQSLRILGVASVLGLIGVSGYRVATKGYIHNLLDREMALAASLPEKYQLLSESLRLDPSNTAVRFARGKLLITHAEVKLGLRDLAGAAHDPALRSDILSLQAELRDAKKLEEAELINLILERLDDGVKP